MKKEVKLEEIMPIILESINDNRTVTFSPNGTSMLPIIRPKVDQVVLEKCVTPIKKYDIVLFQRHDGAYILHRVVGKKRTNLIICGDNQFFKEKIPAERIIARVKYIIKGDRQIDCLYDSRYRLWSFFHCKTFFFRRVWHKMRG